MSTIFQSRAGIYMYAVMLLSNYLYVQMNVEAENLNGDLDITDP
jgi:hypothetical protein